MALTNGKAHEIKIVIYFGNKSKAVCKVELQDLRLDLMFNANITIMNTIAILWGISALKLGAKSYVLLGLLFPIFHASISV